MYRSAPRSRTRCSRIAGFSMVELAVALAVLLILTSIAIPSLTQAFRTYQLNDAVGRVSDLLKFTRFEAVRRNSLGYFKFQKTGVVWTSSSAGSTKPLATDKQLLFTGFANLLPATTSGLPDQGAICKKLVNNSGPCLDGSLSGSDGAVTFDARGAIRVGGSVSSTVFVFYLGSATNPEFGYRAVIQLPSGSTQIWTAPKDGTWQQIG